MAFDLATAKPVEPEQEKVPAPGPAVGGFDLSTARPVEAAAKPAGRQRPPPPPEPKGPEPYTKADLLGPAEALLALGTGAVATPVAGFAGMLSSLGNALDPYNKGVAKSQGRDYQPTENPKTTVEKVQDFLTYRPRTRFGQETVEAVSLPFEKLAELGDWAGGGTAEVTGSPALGAGVNTAIQMAPAAFLRGKKPALEQKIKSNAVAGIQDRILNMASDSVTRDARKAGLKLPPSQARPNLVNKLVEGVGGAPQLAKTLSEKNQPITDVAIRKSLGLGPKTPISVEMLKAVRKTAGQAYKEIADIDQPFHATEAYQQAIRNLDSEVAAAHTEFPTIFKNQAIENLAQSLDVPSMSPSAALELVKKLRRDSKTLKKGKDSPEKLALSRAHDKAAAALEELMEQNLRELGRADLFDNYVTARQTIARSWDVQGALDKTTGRIDATKLGKKLDQDVPLTDEMKLVAKVARQYPTAMQRPQATRGNPLSFWDVAVPIRPPLRAVAASDWYQQLMTKPPTRGSSPAIDAILEALASEGAAPTAAALQGQQLPPR